MADIGIFGGSFDPPHNAHLVTAIEVRERAPLDRVLVVPAARSPFKDADPGLRDPVRLDLLQQLFGHLPGFQVDDRELRRGPPSRTVDTLRELKAELPGDHLHLVMGADTLADLHRWHEVAALGALAAVLVAARPGESPDPPDPVAALPELELRFVETTPLSFSSTQVRSRAASDLPLDGYVPAPVARAIRQERPYR